MPLIIILVDFHLFDTVNLPSPPSLTALVISVLSILDLKGHVTCLAFWSFPVKADGRYQQLTSKGRRVWTWYIPGIWFFPSPLRHQRVLVGVHLTFTHAYTRKKKLQLSIPNVEISGVRVNTILSSPCSSSWPKTRGRWAPAVSYEEQEEMGAMGAMGAMAGFVLCRAGSHLCHPAGPRFACPFVWNQLFCLC